MRPDIIAATCSPFRSIARVNDGDGIDVPVIIRVEFAQVHQWINQIEGVFHHSLGVLRIGSESVLLIGIISFGIWQSNPSHYGAFDGYQSVGNLLVKVADAAGWRQDGIAANPIEQYVVVGLRSRMDSGGMIVEPAKHHEVPERPPARGNGRRGCLICLDALLLLLNVLPRREQALGQAQSIGIGDPDFQPGRSQCALGVPVGVNIPAVVAKDSETIHVFVPVQMFIPAYAQGNCAAVRLGQLHRMRTCDYGPSHWREGELNQGDNEPNAKVQ